MSRTMQRSISRLSQKLYDVAVIGAGIYGAWIAREAALRGLSVALVDQGDFGSATSSNSQRIAHGGLRYLQHADFKRMRESIRERSILMRIAPHLVFPMPVLIPTYRNLLQGKTLMAVALRLNDLIGFDRNRDLSAEKNIPPGRILSKKECLAYCPDLLQQDLTGAAFFFDGQVRNTERLILSLLLSAARSGAVLVNYARVTGFLKNADAIVGMSIEDVLSGKSVETRARVIVNCSGPWTGRVVELAGIVKQRTRKRWLKAALLLTRQLIPNVAVGVRSNFRYQNAGAFLDKGYRYFFITPWRNSSLIGTFEVPYNGGPDDFSVTEDEICAFIEDVNSAYPAGNLTTKDVHFVYGGLVPASDQNGSPNNHLTKHYEICDHALEDGVEGLVSIIGVKYTTARHVAEEAVNLIETKLGKRPAQSWTAVVPVYGGTMNSFQEFLESELQRKRPGLSEETIRHLIQTYGSEYREVLRYCDQDPEWSKPVTSNSPVIRAEILHGVREEMACKLEDILYRRTELGAFSYPDDSCVSSCAEIMAHELRSHGGQNRSGATALA
jgi:glycerol-3-phosphate dehydrogenase